MYFVVSKFIDVRQNGTMDGKIFPQTFSSKNSFYIYISSNILIRMSYVILCILVCVIGNHHRDKCRKHGGGIWALWKKLWGRKSFARHTKFLGSIFWKSSNNSFRHISTATSFTSDICRYISKCIKRNNLSKKYKKIKTLMKTNLIVNYRFTRIWWKETLKSKLSASIWVGPAQADWRRRI